MTTHDEPHLETPVAAEPAPPDHAAAPAPEAAIEAPVEPAAAVVAAPTAGVAAAPAAESWREGFAKLEAELAEQRQLLHEILDRLDVTEAERTDQHRTREELFDKIERSKPSFQFSLVRPLIERVATMYDLAITWERHPPQDAAAMLGHVQVLAAQFRETLQLFGIDVIAPAPNEAFDRRHHFVMEAVPTGDAALNERIAETRQHGFLYYGQNERTAALMPSVVRPARVRMWKFDPKLVAPEVKDGAPAVKDGAPAEAVNP